MKYTVLFINIAILICNSCSVNSKTVQNNSFDQDNQIDRKLEFMQKVTSDNLNKVKNPLIDANGANPKNFH
ncbi:hypothetical protein [Chryseobacterium viscerum]|uniref:Uncharacterized protein n=1 Tax=Chryseobacterium viscerum TaxID=1037377 RepID=A0A316W9C8_9FLAO|nr:hypothetical protein [Chryseobacterium viscerum]PWN57558.1 hypothetical protein C1634_025530 [Chryseobacterium viscerum]